MTDIVTAIYELMGKAEHPPKKGESQEKTEFQLATDEKIKEKVELIFQVRGEKINKKRKGNPFHQFCVPFGLN